MFPLNQQCCKYTLIQHGVSVSYSLSEYQLLSSRTNNYHAYCTYDDTDVPERHRMLTLFYSFEPFAQGVSVTVESDPEYI